MSIALRVLSCLTLVVLGALDLKAGIQHIPDRQGWADVLGGMGMVALGWIFLVFERSPQPRYLLPLRLLGIAFILASLILD